MVLVDVQKSQSTAATPLNFSIDFVRGLCLPFMMIDQLRNQWLASYIHQPLGFFSAMVVFLFLSGFAAGKFYSSLPGGPDRKMVYGLAWK